MPQPAATRFGRFELLDSIGKGGMAEVFRARIVQGSRLGEIVALKRLLPDFVSDSEYVDLFTGEADLAAATTPEHRGGDRGRRCGRGVLYSAGVRRRP